MEGEINKKCKKSNGKFKFNFIQKLSFYTWNKFFNLPDDKKENYFFHNFEVLILFSQINFDKTPIQPNKKNNIKNWKKCENLEKALFSGKTCSNIEKF